MINILCYGDSNTWGYTPGSLDPDSQAIERYSREIRWPGNLQRMLGYDNYSIIEEGLNGRTTNVDYVELPDLNGKIYLSPCLLSHAPLDLVILMLGTNDLKIEFNRSAEELANGIKALVEIIQQPGMTAAPRVLLVAPPVPVHERGFDGVMFKGAIRKAERFSGLFGRIAASHNCYFFDANTAIQLSDIDGIHFDERAHRQFAEKVYQMILAIFD